MIEYGFMVPHPPIAVAEIGKGEEKKIQATLDSYDTVARTIAEIQPELIIVTSPHALLYGDYFNVSSGSGAYGDFRNFRSDVSFEETYDEEFVRVLTEKCEAQQFPMGDQYDREKELDHGTMVPLYFIEKYWKDFKLVRIGLSGLSLPLHYRAGEIINEVVQQLDRRAVFIASGDLAHCQKEDGPYGYKEEGPAYDGKIMEDMGNADFKNLLEYDHNFCSAAMECGHRSFVMMAGAFDGISVKPEVLSHEATFGVGYGFVMYEPQGGDENRHFLDAYLNEEADRLNDRNRDAYVKLAEAAISSWVKNREKITVDETVETELTTNRAGVFVSIKEFGELRGCIGTTQPYRKNIAEEIISNAISACSRDPRFTPVMVKELPYLKISVDVLQEAEEIPDGTYLDVKKYGVICSDGDGRVGLLLPDIEGVDTVEQQIAIACRKGNIDINDPTLKLERFEVIRHE